jgi:surface protein
MVQCARGATTMKDWLPGTKQQRFEIAIEKTQKSIAAVEGIGRTIRGKYLVWLQGESDGAGNSVGSKKTTYKTRFLQFWNAIKAQLGFEKCFIIRVHKFRDGYSYNCFPIIEAQEELALENDDIEMVTRVTGYLQYYDENPEHYTIQHAFQGLQIVGNHDHYTWEGYKLVGDTAGSRVGQYMNTGVMPALEPEPWPTKITASTNCHIATYKYDNTIYEDYVPEFNEGYQYRVIDKIDANITTRQIIGVGLPTLMRFGAYYTYEELNGNECSATARELCLKEVTFADTRDVTDATNMFCFNSNLTSLPAIVIKECPSLYAMFYKCTSLTNIDASNFNVSKTTDMENFVCHCSNLTSINIEGWNTSNVVNMYNMFAYSENLAEIIGLENLNIEKVKTMISIFDGCHSIKNLDLSNWNVENATTILRIFRNCNTLETLDLSNWHLVNCKNYSQALQGCDLLTNVIMKYGDYNTVNNIIEQLPSKTAKAPGTLLINNVDSFEQVNLEAAAAKYWNIEYKHEVTNFNKKIVNGEMLNKFAKKFNKKIQNKIDIVDSKTEVIDKAAIDEILLDVFGTTTE